MIVDGVLHVLILASILTAFYFLVASKLGKSVLRSEIRNNIEDNLVPALKNADTNNQVKNAIQEVNFEKLKSIYQSDSEVTVTQNKWIERVTIGTLIFLFVVLFVIVSLLRTFCTSVPIGRILKENLILFSLVGMAEVLFFLNVGRKFVPTKPSLIVETVIDSVKKAF
jgi:hypothetical protein